MTIDLQSEKSILSFDVEQPIPPEIDAIACAGKLFVRTDDPALWREARVYRVEDGTDAKVDQP